MPNLMIFIWRKYGILQRNLVQRQDDFRLGASSQDQLRSFGFLRQMCPTYEALLCFGLNPAQWLPGATTRCIHWLGNEKHNGWSDEQEYRGDLIAQFESGRRFLQKRLRLTRKIGRDERSEELEIPLNALEDALANALVHREYMNRTASVSIDIFDNRVEISNPGPLPEPMTLDLLEEEHRSHPRNPQIARIFYLHQYVDKVGSGIQRMQNALKNAKLEPAKFELGKDNTLKVIFYRPQQSAEEPVPLSVSNPVTDPSIGHQSVTPPKRLSSPNLIRRRPMVIAGLVISLSSLGGAVWWATRPQPTCIPSSSLTSTPIASAGLLTPGVLLWGADPGPRGAPYVFRDANNALVGFEVEIATAIANRMGITQLCYPTKYKWENEQDLQARHIDIILNGWEVTQKRLQDEFFSTPYYRSSQQLVVARKIQVSHNIKHHHR